MAERSERPTRDAFTFFHPLRVRWSELDPQGIVFNPNYFVYFDLAVTEYLRAIDFTYPQGFTAAGNDMFAVHAEASFTSSARYDDMIDIGARVERLGRTSYAFALGIFRGDALLVHGRVVYVNASLADRRPTPIPQTLVDAVLAFERVAPVRA